MKHNFNFKLRVLDYELWISWIRTANQVRIHLSRYKFWWQELIINWNKGFKFIEIEKGTYK